MEKKIGFSKDFKPEKLYDLIRIGRNRDGGYLVGKNSLEKSKRLISFGIGDDCSFEKDFLEKNKILCIAYDYTVGNKFWLGRLWYHFGNFFYRFKVKPILEIIIQYIYFKKFFKNNKLISEKVTYDTVEKTIELNKDNYPLFFKIDIEGHEYRILDGLIKYSEFISGIVIEFHDVDLHTEKILHFIKNIKLKLVHIHPNNISEYDKEGNSTVVEFTFEKNPTEVSNTVNLPHELDCDNDTRFKKSKLIFED